MALLVSGTRLAIADSPIVIKFSHDVPLTHIKGIAVERFKHLVEQRLKGRVIVQDFHSGQLYPNAAQSIQALQAGAIQMVAPTMAKWTPLMPEYSLFTLPYVFTSQAMMREVMMSPKVGQVMFKRLKKKGLLGLTIWAQGFRHIVNRKRPIKTLEDLKGLKFRIQKSRVFADFFAAAGASSEALPFTETYMAISQGVIDGAEAPFNAVKSVKWYEVAPYLTTSGHMFSSYLVATNAKFWEGLPPDIRSQLTKILDEVTQWEWGYAAKAAATDRKFLEAKGMKIYDLPPAEKKRWALYFRKVHKKYEAVIGKDILAALYKIADKY